MNPIAVSETESRLLACLMVFLALFAFCFIGMAAADSTYIRSVFYGWERIIRHEAYGWKLFYQGLRDSDYGIETKKFLDWYFWIWPFVYDAVIALLRLPVDVLIIGDYTTLKTIKSGILIGWNITGEVASIFFPLPPPLAYTK